MLTLQLLAQFVVTNSNDIICGKGACQNNQYCVEGEDCTIVCNGDNACLFATLTCSKNYKCTITCSEKFACHGSRIDGSESSELIINGCTDANACSLSEIYCPPNVGGTKKCTISGNNNIRNGLSYYAINGWYDVNIINYTGDYSVDNSNMYCLSNYSSHCSLASNSFECDPKEDTLCNGIISSTSPPTPYISISEIASSTPTDLPSIPPTYSIIRCDDSKYVGWLSALVHIEKNHNQTDERNKTVTPSELINYMTICKKDSPCDIALSIHDDVVIPYNEYIPFNCCFSEEKNIKDITFKINSTEFTQCIDQEIDDDTTTLIQNIHIWLKNIHPYIEFAIPEFTIFVIIFIVIATLIILTFLNWIYSKVSYWMCCCCSLCGCMAADEANLTILFVVSLRIGDLITDGLLAYNIYRYYLEFEKQNKYILSLTVLNASTLILPYLIINIWTMINTSKLNTRTARLREWFKKYKFIILFVTIITGDFYISLLLFKSNLFGIDLFDSGLSSSDLATLRKFKIAMIICENIPQGVTQLIFGWYIKDFTVVSMSLIFSFCVNFGNVIAWYMNKNFDKKCMVCDYYLEITLSHQNIFDNDTSKIRRYSKCRNRLRDKLVNVISENTSSVQCEVYYVEMIGSGCNIHIIHYLPGNAKIKTESTGSIPMSDAKYMDINTIIAIYDGKFKTIESEIGALWRLQGTISVDLRLYRDESNVHMPDQKQLQMSIHNRVYTHSNVDMV